jgi:hypothetical protein
LVLSPVSGGLAVDYLWLHGDGSMALGANSGSGVGVLWLQGGIQMPGVGTVGQVLRDDGTKFVPGQLQFSDLAGQFGSSVAVKTTTTDQSVATETLHFSIPVTAGSTVGTAWRVVLWGNADNGAAAITFVSQLRWGGLTGVVLPMVGSGFTSPASAQTGKSWRMEYLLVITSVGAVGTARASYTLYNSTASTPVFAAGDTGASDVININTTINTTLVVSWLMTAITGAPHVRTFGGMAELVRRP